MFVKGIPHSYYLRNQNSRSISLVMESPKEVTFHEVIMYAQRTYKLKELSGTYDLVHEFQGNQEVIALIDEKPFYSIDKCYQGTSLERKTL